MGSRYQSNLDVMRWGFGESLGLSWICGNIDMERDRLEFVGSGWGFLWRGLVSVIGSILIITIPSLAVWFIRWATRDVNIHRATV